MPDGKVLIEPFRGAGTRRLLACAEKLLVLNSVEKCHGITMTNYQDAYHMFKKRRYSVEGAKNVFW